MSMRASSRILWPGVAIIATDRNKPMLARANIGEERRSRLVEITDKVAETLLSRFGPSAIEGATRAVLVTAKRPRN